MLNSALLTLKGTVFYNRDVLLTIIKKLPIGGIKFSEERVHYAISRPTKAQATINDLLQQIHSKQVNIPFLCHTTLKDSMRTCFCVSGNDAPSITEIIQHSSTIKSDIATQHQVGSVTIFPHKRSLSFIAMVMSVLESIPLPIYSSCTSISAFVFNTSFHDLQTVANELTTIFELPENHSPFYPEFLLRQPRNSIDP